MPSVEAVNGPPSGNSRNASPVGTVVAVIGVPEHAPVPFHTFLMYTLPEALKSAGAALLSCGTAKAKNALGEPTKLGINSPASALGTTPGPGKITFPPSTWMLKVIWGRLLPESSQVPTP